MDGLMMNRPLRVADILTFACEIHGDQGIVSSTVEGGMHRQSYAEMGLRSRMLAKALLPLGI